MESKYLQYRQSLIHYTVFGNGDMALLAFHGFGEAGSSFHCLEPALGKAFTVYCFDLPYHGQTQWLQDMPFSRLALEDMIGQFLDEQDIHQFSVMGFSMGGKCAMALAKKFTDRMQFLMLMASDGIRTKKLYNIAVYPRWGRYVFKSIIKRPAWFFTFIRTMHVLHLISPWLYKFTMNHLDTTEKRQRLYDTWISMADFKVDVMALKQKLNASQVVTYLFFGERDEVIPVSVGKYFAEGLLNCHLIILQRGHYFIDSKLNTELENIFT